jgi:hypothetical protein
MMIVPELETVFIFVPRTGSGTLYRELRRVYPRSMLLYRHMEADGCPRGYDRWQRTGFVRHPLLRLWSLYNFMRGFQGGALVQHDRDKQRIWKQVDRPFEDWLLHNEQPWTVPYDLSGEGAYWPVLERTHTAPENKLSQWSYLRPDLGTDVLKFVDLHQHMRDWGLSPALCANSTQASEPPSSPAISAHIQRFCKWDLETS